MRKHAYKNEATNIDYKIVYDDLFLANKEYISKRNNKISRALRNRHNGLSPRSGIFKDIYTKYLTDLGWKYVSLIKFGSKERTKLDQLTHFDNIILLRKKLEEAHLRHLHSHSENFQRNRKCTPIKKKGK